MNLPLELWQSRSLYKQQAPTAVDQRVLDTTRQGRAETATLVRGVHGDQVHVPGSERHALGATYATATGPASGPSSTVVSQVSSSLPAK